MSERDRAIERAIQLISRSNTATVLRVADELEDSLELGTCAVLPLTPKDGRTGNMMDALREAYD